MLAWGNGKFWTLIKKTTVSYLACRNLTRSRLPLQGMAKEKLHFCQCVLELGWQSKKTPLLGNHDESKCCFIFFPPLSELLWKAFRWIRLMKGHDDHTVELFRRQQIHTAYNWKVLELILCHFALRPLDPFFMLLAQNAFCSHLFLDEKNLHIDFVLLRSLFCLTCRLKCCGLTTSILWCFLCRYISIKIDTATLIY